MFLISENIFYYIKQNFDDWEKDFLMYFKIFAFTNKIQMINIKRSKYIYIKII